MVFPVSVLTKICMPLPMSCDTPALLPPCKPLSHTTNSPRSSMGTRFAKTDLDVSTRVVRIVYTHMNTE